ncbi:YfiR/HmsC family protein [Aurantibacillus circumpalustris]|uniref:YfiR/HmsC family protein n=1 Tax=Aurantibacillus circumpalustris TaxID=3036359 RepID=UPI00295AAD40|nr:YfiR/HmsC family protein [Aurantibacillus circumpalustris]
MTIKIKITLLLVISLLIPFFITSQTKPKVDLEKSARLKAVYIYKFTNYVIWPNEENMSEFIICVMSSEDLHNQLKGIQNIVKFRNKIPIRVIYCRGINDIRTDCQMLVVDGSRNDNLWSAYSKIRGKGILMVAEKLPDFKRSMISFAETGGRIKYIINKPKLVESNLIVKDQLYESAIVKEGEWKSIFDKLDAIASSGDGEVRVDKDDIKKILTSYKTLEEEKKAKETMILQMEDTLKVKLEILKSKQHEYDQVSTRIQEQKNLMESQDIEIRKKKTEIDEATGTIGKQKNVISIIAVLSAVGILLLFFSIRSNNQRRKANKLLSEQKNEIEKQKHLVDEKQKEIVDSINYAKRIQTALMANSSLMSANLDEHFILFKPKDIVAGDFYWASKHQDSFIYITADCTGHGVPGAFMSLLNISKLNDAVNQKITRPDLVLNEVKSGIIRALNPEGSLEESKDGMDAILCKLDRKNMKLQFAAANNSFCIIRKNTIINCKADKMPVGKSHDDNALFTFNEIDLEKGDMIYTFTDGYGDQFGGPDGKKFMHKQLRKIFIDVAEKHVDRQKEIIDESFEKWKGSLEQVDDVLIIGVKV